MENLNLVRPLVFFDLETTGVDPASDRIVEIAAVRLEPGGERESRVRRINPERPIPPGATAVHGIRDEDVREEPTFRQMARSFLDFLDGADLAGFNVARFDLPLLAREFSDCGLDMKAGERRVLDAMTIFHRKERRDLSAAVRFYLGHDLEGAHSADADVAATLQVLDAQLARYPDLPRTVEALDAWTRSTPGAVDSGGKLLWRGGEVVLGFGKHRGRTLREMVTEAPDYLKWILNSDFPADACDIVRGAFDGDFPSEPGSR